MTSKRIGLILIAIFIAGLGAFTIYSRWYVQRQKPLVHITFAQSAALEWWFETRSTIEPAAPDFAAQGFEWTIDVYIPLSAFEDYMSAPYRVRAIANTDNVYFDEELRRIYRELLDCGGYLYVFEYTSRLREQFDMPYIAGEGVTVRIENYLGGEPLIFNFLLPRSAIQHDPFEGEDSFFTVHRRNSAWGWEYYVRQHTAMYSMPRMVRDLVNLLPIIADPDTTPIVFLSETELYDGALVRLWD